MANDEQDSGQSQADPGEADVTSSESGDQESPDQTSTAEDQVTLEELEKITGKTFKSKEKALKSIKDTQGYVGDLGSTVAQYEEQYGSLDGDSNDDNDSSSTSDEDVMTKAEYKREKFFDENPKYKEHRDVIEALSERKGVPVQEAVEMEGVKSLFESQSELEKLKSEESVAMSNNRVGQSSDEMDEARQAVQKANEAELSGDVTQANQQMNTARSKAVEAVTNAISGDQ